MNMSPTCVCVNLHTHTQCFVSLFIESGSGPFVGEADFESGSRSMKDIPATGETYLQLFKENIQLFKI